MTESVLDISGLSVAFDTPDGLVEAVKGVSLSISAGECLGVVGESGSGKTQTFLAAFGLAAQNARVSGAVSFDGADFLQLKRAEMDSLRGRRVAFVFQDPLTALTPHLTIEEQMGEVLRQHRGMRGEASRGISIEWLERVRISEAAQRLAQYPHELSGGMRQRVMIAMAMMCEPALLVRANSCPEGYPMNPPISEPTNGWPDMLMLRHIERAIRRWSHEATLSPVHDAEYL